MARAVAEVGLLGATRTTLGRAARRTTLNIRFTVVVALVLIAGSFAAAAVLQMRLDRVHALSQAAYFETRHADEIADLVDGAFDRYAEAGRAFADRRADADLAPPGLRNIAVFDGEGIWGAVLKGSAVDFPDLPVDLVARAARGPTIATPSVVAFPYRRQVIAILFDPKAVVPASLLAQTMVTTSNGVTLVQGPSWIAGSSVEARARHWPLRVRVAIDEEAALSAWYGSLPLYLFVILGPALVGAGLAAVFVQEFERRAKAAQAIRALRATRPTESRILVRLANAERRAVEATRSKSEFIAHMSHELRTPLNAIIGFSEVIEHGLYGPAGHPKYAEYAHDIAIAGRNLHSKIGDILEFANIEAGRFPLQPERFSLCELALECVNEHAGRAFSRRIGLALGVVDPVEAEADMLATKRVIANLIGNALAYTRAGGQVRIDVRREEGAAIVRIRDNGMGFSVEECARVGDAFQRFERAGATTGAGLGLAIAAALARRMGGALRIGSVQGQGTSAELRLPRPPVSTET